MRKCHSIIPAIVLVFAAMFASATAHAADLSSGDVKRWAESTQSVKVWADKHAPTLKNQMKAAGAPKSMTAYPSITPEQMEAMGAPMSFMVNGVQSAGMGGEFSSIVAEHGFSSAAEWGSIGDRVLKAMMTLELTDRGDPRAEMSKALAEVQNSPHVSDAQKQQMMAMMEGSMKMLELMADAPPEDVEAVRPHRSLLRNAFSD